jgi:hypothetical protein
MSVIHTCPVGARALGERRREVAAAGGDVEHARARAHAAHLEREALPQAMQPQRHEVVHQVVGGRDRAEDLAHAPGLLLLGDLLVAEVRLVSH